MKTRKLLLIFVFALLGGFKTEAQEKKHLTPELLWQLGRVSLQDVSADGVWVLYSVKRYKLEENKGQADLYIAKAWPTKEEKPIQLTHTPESEYNARFHPDGQHIGFLRNGHLYEMKLDGSEERQVSEMEMTGFSYSPQGHFLLYTAEVKHEPSPSDIYPDLDKTTGLLYDDLMFRHWTEWEDGYYSNIFYAPYQDGRLVGDPQPVMNEAYDSPLKPFGGMEQIAWSPDERFIAYTCKKLKGVEYARSTNSDIYLFDRQTGYTSNISQGMQGYDMNPTFSPDGKVLIWNSMKTPGYESDRNRIFAHDMQKKIRWEITKGLDQNADNPQWAPDGSSIYFTSPWRGSIQIFQIDFTKKGRLRQLTGGHYNHYGVIVRENNIFTLRCSMKKPHEVYRVVRQTGKAIQVSHANDDLLNDIAMGKVIKKWIKTTDGKRMLVWVIVPPDFDPEKKYPTLLYCQGGPQSTVSQFWSYRWNFELMAAQGYVVVAPNRRGLPSFGRKWNDEIAGDWGGQAQQDLLTAIDELSKEPYVDTSRLGAVGASYGGYSVYWLAGHHQGRFKTFIAHAGLFNLESWYGSTEELFFADHDIGGPYWKDPRPESYDKFSPHLFVQNWDTPILIIHNQLDFRVPLEEGLQAFTAARLQGLDARLLYFPDEGHWVLKPQNGVLWHRVFFDWLARYLKEKADKTKNTKKDILPPKKTTIMDH